MMKTANPFARIVVGYDDSKAADTALRQAVALAEKYGGEIVAVNVSDLPAPAALLVPTKAAPPALDARPVLRSVDAERRDLFEKLSRFVESREVPVWMEFAMNGAAAGILDAARRWKATAIAIGTHARTGVAHLVAGSVAQEVLRSASVPVVVTRADSVRQSMKRVLVGIDTSEPSANVRAFAMALAGQPDVYLCYCTVIHTAPYPSTMRAEGRDALDAARRDANREGVDPDTEVAEGADADIGLCESARRHDADAIVVGNHKRGDLERLFAFSTAESLIRRADRPVIVVPMDPAMWLRDSNARGKVSA
jgi:nucleotide-binding universal stress UspA family protein